MVEQRSGNKKQKNLPAESSSKISAKQTIAQKIKEIVTNFCNNDAIYKSIKSSSEEYLDIAADEAGSATDVRREVALLRASQLFDDSWNRLLPDIGI